MNSVFWNKSLDLLKLIKLYSSIFYGEIYSVGDSTMSVFFVLFMGDGFVDSVLRSDDGFVTGSKREVDKVSMCP